MEKQIENVASWMSNQQSEVFSYYEGPERRPEGGEWEPIKILRENKTYVPNSTRHTSLLTAKATHANK